MKLLAAAAVLFATSTAFAAPPTNDELEACLGKDAGFAPALSAFKRGMTTDEANAVWDGAGKVDKYGFSTVKAKGCVGAAQFKLYFQKDAKTGVVGLYSAAIDWDKALTTNKDFYQRLVAVLTAKFGEVKDPKAIDKKLVTWVTNDFSIIQLTTLGPSRSFDLKMSLPKG
ncbi:MAG: hypothetical protein QM831_35610 [Kofleriaceae bacterium]